jgi:hypothetical protein
MHEEDFDAVAFLLAREHPGDCSARPLSVDAVAVLPFLGFLKDTDASDRIDEILILIDTIELLLDSGRDCGKSHGAK